MSVNVIQLMTEQNIILAVIGMVGLFATATIWQRANRITDRYYKANKINRDLITRRAHTS
jgi:hypothetical protein